MKTKQELAALEELAYNSAESPTIDASGWLHEGTELKLLSCQSRGGALWPHDAEFFARARDIVLELVGDVMQLQDEQKRLIEDNGRWVQASTNELLAMAHRAQEAERERDALRAEKMDARRKARAVIAEARGQGFWGIYRIGTDYVLFRDELQHVQLAEVEEGALWASPRAFDIVVEAIVRGHSFACLDQNREYHSLAELKSAFDSGLLNPEECSIILDNGACAAYDYSQDEEGECLYNNEESPLLEEALDLLGVPWRKP